MLRRTDAPPRLGPPARRGPRHRHRGPHRPHRQRPPRPERQGVRAAAGAGRRSHTRLHEGRAAALDLGSEDGRTTRTLDSHACRLRRKLGGDRRSLRRERLGRRLPARRRAGGRAPRVAGARRMSRSAAPPVLLGALGLCCSGLGGSRPPTWPSARQTCAGASGRWSRSSWRASHIDRGEAITRGQLAVRRVPARFAPRIAFAAPAEVAGARAASAIDRGHRPQPRAARRRRAGRGGALLGRRARRAVARIVAIGSADELDPGRRRPICSSRDDGRMAAPARGWRCAAPRSSSPGRCPPAGRGGSAGLPRVALALRVTLRHAVYLAQAQAGARELQALPRPPSASRRLQ